MTRRPPIDDAAARTDAVAECWICRKRPADTSEHRFKASDVRLKAPSVSQANPLFIQRFGRATNTKVGSARAKHLTFRPSICSWCNNTATQPSDLAWQRLSEYLHRHWPEIRRRRQFAMSTPFPGGSRVAALQVHLYFLKLFGCKIVEDKEPIDLTGFSEALRTAQPHPEVSILIADGTNDTQGFLAYDSGVYIMRNQQGEIHGAIWLYLIHPIAIKVGYIKAGQPLYLPGHPWHPSKPGKIVKLSSFSGATEPLAGRRALLHGDGEKR